MDSGKQLVHRGSPWCSVMTERGGMGQGRREAQAGGGICIFIADSHSCTAQHCKAISSIQTVIHVRLCDLMAAAHHAFLSITNSQSLFKLMFIKSVMPSNCLILCHPLLLPSIFPSTTVFSNESVFCIWWPEYWSFSFSISLSSEYSETDIFQDWLVWSPCSPRDSQESSPTPQFKSINSSVLSCLYSPTLTSIPDSQKNHLTIQTFVSKVMSLLFNMLSRLVIAFLPRNKFLLISWLQSPSAMILESKKIKSTTVSIVSPSICHEVMGPDAIILVFWIMSFKLDFHSPLSLSSRGSSVPLHFLP